MSHAWRLAFGFVAVAASAPAMAQSGPDCFAAITSPPQGTAVPLKSQVEGASSTYGDVSVWVFTHRKGISDWWPQNGGPVGGGPFGWSANVTYGMQKEAGQTFEVAVVPVSRLTNQGLSGWVARAVENGDYSGIPLPEPAKGCRTHMISVQRY